MNHSGKFLRRVRIVVVTVVMGIQALVIAITPTVSSGQVADFNVTATTLKPTTQKSDGRCPVTIAFAGSITTNGPGKVNYKFIRKNGSSGEPRSLDFNAAGTKAIETEVTLGGPTASSGDWIAVRVTSPTSVDSNKAEFTMDCDKGESHSEPFIDTRKLYYILPRAYPTDSINDDMRFSAFAQLNAFRQSLNQPHVNVQSSSGPQAPGQHDDKGCAWYSAGPTNINGRITAIASDPNNTRNIFVTTVGGIWRSRDGGARWQRVSDDFLASIFASIAVNPLNGNEVFAGAGEPNYHDVYKSGIGIWRSKQSGEPKSWFKVSPPAMDGQVIYRLIIDPVAPNNIYAATSAGVYLGTRGPSDSIQWDQLDQFGGFATDIAVDFTATPRKVYAGLWGEGIWKYDGTSWHERTDGIDKVNAGAIAITLSASNPNVLYAKASNRQDGRLLGVYKTTTAAETVAGDAWSILTGANVLDDSRFPNGDGYSWYNNVIAVDPANSDIVYAGGMSLYRSLNGGASWTPVSDGADQEFATTIHPDQHVVAFDPLNSKILLVGTDGGIYRSTETSLQTWHWNNISHGMVITEFYRIASQQATATVIAGGSQDNGTEITFGNRTWYNPGDCDGADVAVDGKNSSTLYANCNGTLYLLANPVPHTPGGGTRVPWTSPYDIEIIPPLVTDEAIPGAVIASGASITARDGPKSLLKSIDGITWNTIVPALPANTIVSFIAIAPSSSFQAYYVGVGDPKGSVPPDIWRSSDGGLTWDQSASGLPGNLWPAAAAVDFNNASRAVAVFGGSAGGAVLLTINGGNTWTDLFNGAPGFIKQVPVTGVVIDPNDSNVVYIATRLGVFKGLISPGPVPSASWLPFDEGLPDGLEVNTIAVNRGAGLLSIGSMGHGVFQRDIRPQARCSGAMLVVRDNVFDIGRTPSPQNIPDPEHPILDSSRQFFFRPNDTSGGQVYWWTSPDIRFSVSSTAAANRIANPDHVEFESCPIEISNCPAGTLVDSPPVSGQPAKIHTQISNRGIRAASNVRVMALWTDSRNLTFPKLPTDFWTRTFPAGTTDCGSIDNSTGWNLVNPTTPCQVIPLVNPELPEVVTFPWNVPTNINSACVLVIVESADDPIDPAIRSTNETRIWALVPNVRQMGLRNLQVIRANITSDLFAAFRLTNSTTSDSAFDVVVSRNLIQSQDRVEFLLPQGSDRIEQNDFGELTSRESHQTFMRSNSNALAQIQLGLTAFEGTLVQYPVSAMKTRLLGFRFDGNEQVQDKSSKRISVITRENGVITGGITYVFRH